MSRIRSIHPGQWTDEDFVVCSLAARLLAIAIRNEADDHGAFEWKPLTLKMRLFPADPVNIDELLDELVENRQVTRYAVDGKDYGLIRNFAKYQHPKKPSYFFPVPNSEAVMGDEFPTSSEPVPEEWEKVSPEGREEEEKRREEKRESEARASDAPDASNGSPLDLKRECWERGKRLMVEKWHIPKSKVGPLLGKWAKDHGFPLVIDALARAEAEAPAEPISFVEGILKHREGMNGAGRHNGNGRANAGDNRPEPGGIVGATLGALATIRARKGDLRN